MMHKDEMRNVAAPQTAGEAPRMVKDAPALESILTQLKLQLADHVQRANVQMHGGIESYLYVYMSEAWAQKFYLLRDQINLAEKELAEARKPKPPTEDEQILSMLIRARDQAQPGYTRTGPPMLDIIQTLSGCINVLKARIERT